MAYTSPEMAYSVTGNHESSQPMTDIPQPILNQPMVPGGQQSHFYHVGPAQHSVMNSQPMLVSQTQTGQPLLLSYPTGQPAIIDYKQYQGKCSVILGVSQIALGLLAVILQTFGFDMQMKLKDLKQCCLSQSYYAFSGLWCAVLFVICGGFAIAAGRRKTKCLVLATLVLAVVALVFAMVLVGFASWAVDFDSNGPYAIDYDFYVDYRNTTTTTTAAYYDSETSEKQRSYSQVSLAMGAMMLVCGLVEMMMSVWLVILCCKILCPCDVNCDCCCCCHSNGSFGNQMVVFLSNGPGQPGEFTQGLDQSTQHALTPPAYQTTQSANQVQPWTHAEGIAPPAYTTDPPAKTTAIQQP